jgi:Gnt-I system high-affinity gluconate transporter
VQLWFVAFSIVLLVVLITKAKVHPFLAFLVTSMVAGALLGLPLRAIPAALEKGLGATLGPLLAIICLGAMFGKVVAESGAAQRIAGVLVAVFGPKYITWAMMLTGFIVGLPLFYNVGFVLLVPLVFSVARQAGLPAIYLGVPLLAALSVTHGFLPPHPAPTAMVPMFNARMSTTLLYGLVVSLPAIVLAGPILARAYRNAEAKPLTLFAPPLLPPEQLPGAFNSFSTTLFPVLLIALSAAFPAGGENPGALLDFVQFLTNPLVVMLLALALSSYTLGVRRGMTLVQLVDHYNTAIKDVAVILLVVAGAGTLKQVFVESGVSNDITAALRGVPLNPLLLGWMIATVLRVSLGSATVAGLTAAGIMAPVVSSSGVDGNLMVLAIGAGSLMLSHVNDSGFWMCKEYFNLSLKETLMSWTLMEGIVGVVGIIGVLILDLILH